MDNITFANFKPERNAVVVVKLPTDETGTLVYDVEQCQDIYNQCAETFKDNPVLCLTDSTTLENYSKDDLLHLRNTIDKILRQKFPNSRKSIYDLLEKEYDQFLGEDD